MSLPAVPGLLDAEWCRRSWPAARTVPTPYHQTKFEAELLVRSTAGLRQRVYRPAVVVGDSRTGEMDKIDGPYYFFGLLSKLAVLPKFTPMVLPDTGRTNIVPVDFVVDALVELMHSDGRDGQTFHLTGPKTIGLRGIYRGVAEAAGLPPLRGSLPGATATPFLRVTGRAKVLRNMAATQLGVPGEILDVVDLAPTFTATNTEEALHGTGITVPEFASYAPQLWRYWAEHLDPDRARRDDPAGPLVGKHVIITGASSGIGRASAIAIAERGGCVFALARNAEALDDLIAEIRTAGRGLVEKPARIDTPVGTLADFGNYLTPKLSRRVLHQLYLGYPDSAAARGMAPAKSSTHHTPSRRPKRPARRANSLRALRPVTTPIKRAVRLVPGVHW
jgi:uncharacterized protein YbjT (DUF2867 family)